MPNEIQTNLLAKNSQFLVPFRTSVTIAFSLAFGKYNFFFGLLGCFLLLIHASNSASTPCSLSTTTTLILSLIVLLRACCISIIALDSLLCGELLRVQVTYVLVGTVSLLNTLQWMWMVLLHLFVCDLLVRYIWECLVLLRCSNFLLGYELWRDRHFGLFWSRLTVDCNRIFSWVQCWQFYVRSSCRFHVLIWSRWWLFRS